VRGAMGVLKSGACALAERARATATKSRRNDWILKTSPEGKAVGTIIPTPSFSGD
jgi:hypothetical protein